MIDQAKVITDNLLNGALEMSNLEDANSIENDTGRLHDKTLSGSFFLSKAIAEDSQAVRANKARKLKRKGANAPGLLDDGIVSNFARSSML